MLLLWLAWSPSVVCWAFFNLVEPRAMIGCVVKDNPMRRLAQKGRPALPSVQDALLALHAQLDIQVRLVCDPAHQTLRAVDVQVVHHDVPAAGARIAGDDALEVGEKIRFGAGRPCRWRQKVPTRHIAAQDERAGAMADVLMFAPLDL